MSVLLAAQYLIASNTEKVPQMLLFATITAFASSCYYPAGITARLSGKGACYQKHTFSPIA
jgi:hypothetical protein